MNSTISIEVAKLWGIDVLLYAKHYDKEFYKHSLTWFSQQPNEADAVIIPTYR